jgi:hypothetical protein
MAMFMATIFLLAARLAGMVPGVGGGGWQEAELVEIGLSADVTRAKPVGCSS